MAMITKARRIVWSGFSCIALLTADAQMYLVEAQTSSTTRTITMQGAADPSSGPIIRDAVGRPCLDVEAAARAHATNKDVIDHVVSVKNNCPRLIKVKVCYFNSEQCNAFDLQGYKRVDTILGTMTKITAFRYSITQR